jgi:ubiquinone/menaquinone biosynthesis C-methylase UbiE
VAVDWKQRAIEQWTADPCGPRVSGAEALLRARRAYAPWMPSALDYDGAADLDVLDVGCGQGIDLCEYARAGARVTGIDLTPRHVELARQHLAELGLVGAAVVEGDAERLPFPDESFDLVSSNGVLHHTPDMVGALKEIRRVLRQDGRLTVIVYNRRSAHYWLHQVLLRGIVQAGLVREGGMAGVLSAHVERSTVGARPLVRALTASQLRAMLHQAGFGVASVEPTPFQPHETLFTKKLTRVPQFPVGWYLIGRARRDGGE